MPKLVLITNSSDDTARLENVNLHMEIIETLFQYKKILSNRFDDIKGTFFIDHFAVIISYNNTILVFSVTPSVEYNLLSQGLWKFDKAFSPHFLQNDTFSSWDIAYEKKYFDEIKNLKQLKHEFTFGFNLPKETTPFQLIYSFATRAHKLNLIDYYQSSINELFGIGDYLFQSINSIVFEKYSRNITKSFVKPEQMKNCTFLKLIK